LERDKSRIPLVPEVTGGEFVPNILTRSTSAFIDQEMSSGDTVKFQGCVVAAGASFKNAIGVTLLKSKFDARSCTLGVG
jgi:hypothetical protein